jgi:hypothetical protein
VSPDPCINIADGSGTAMGTGAQQATELAVSQFASILFSVAKNPFELTVRPLPPELLFHPSQLYRSRQR